MGSNNNKSVTVDTAVPLLEHLYGYFTKLEFEKVTVTGNKKSDITSVKNCEGRRIDNPLEDTSRNLVQYKGKVPSLINYKRLFITFYLLSKFKNQSELRKAYEILFKAAGVTDGSKHNAKSAAEAILELDEKEIDKVVSDMLKNPNNRENDAIVKFGKRLIDKDTVKLAEKYKERDNFERFFEGNIKSCLKVTKETFKEINFEDVQPDIRPAAKQLNLEPDRVIVPLSKSEGKTTQVYSKEVTTTKMALVAVDRERVTAASVKVAVKPAASEDKNPDQGPKSGNPEASEQRSIIGQISTRVAKLAAKNGGKLAETPKIQVRKNNSKAYFEACMQEVNDKLQDLSSAKISEKVVYNDKTRKINKEDKQVIFSGFKVNPAESKTPPESKLKLGDEEVANFDIHEKHKLLRVSIKHDASRNAIEESTMDVSYAFEKDSIMDRFARSHSQDKFKHLKVLSASMEAMRAAALQHADENGKSKPILDLEITSTNADEAMYSAILALCADLRPVFAENCATNDELGVLKAELQALSDDKHGKHGTEVYRNKRDEIIKKYGVKATNKEAYENLFSNFQTTSTPNPQD